MDILGHPIPAPLHELIREVERAFPHKQLRVAPFENASDELGVPVISANHALTRPDVDKYVAIWIKKELHQSEFESALAEELVHNLQAARGATKVVYVEGMDGPPEKIEHFWDNVTSTSWDFEARQRVHDSGLHAQSCPFVLDRLKQAVEIAESNPEPYGQGKHGTAGLCDYLLWHWELNALGDPATRLAFLDFAARIWSLSPKEIRELWESAARKLWGHQDQDLRMIATHLKCTIRTEPVGTSGKQLVLI